MYSYKIELVRVIDGDTIDASVDLGFGLSILRRIRLYGIDTPETRTRDLDEKAAGLKAKEWLANRLKSATKLSVTTLKDKEGKYGRLIGVLYADNVNIQKTMLSLGLAKKYGE